MFYRIAATLSLIATTSQAEVPSVVTDIAPIHSLVTRVMQGVGEPHLILPPGVSPHSYAMRPSEARNLQDADLVIWMGEELTPWLEDAIESLSGDAQTLELLHLDGTHLLDNREEAVFGGDHDEHHDDEHKDDHADEHHGEHGDDHAEEHKDHHDDDHHDDEKHAAEDEHAHDHGAHDPHAWLDPKNAQFWLGKMAEKLSEIDPNNAELYTTNAVAAASEIDDLTETLRADLADYSDARFIVFHDAYQYFENAFGLKAAGALQVSDATAPSAARLAEIQEEIAEHGVTCVFAEPQFNPGLIGAVAVDGVKSGELDPLGASIAPGPSHYLAMLQQLAQNATDCLK